MSSEIFYPFSLDRTGAVASTSSPAVMAQQHVDSLVSTAQGERVMLPTYGVNLVANLFANSSDATAAALANDVGTAMSVWEPAIQVLNVTPLYSDYQEGIVNIEVDYSVGTTPVSSGNVNTATVLVGGSVIEIVRSQSV